MAPGCYQDSDEAPIDCKSRNREQDSLLGCFDDNWACLQVLLFMAGVKQVTCSRHLDSGFFPYLRHPQMSRLPDYQSWQHHVMMHSSKYLFLNLSPLPLPLHPTICFSNHPFLPVLKSLFCDILIDSSTKSHPGSTPWPSRAQRLRNR